ncbi:FAD-dependent monooxygenase [Rubellimicrobium aerolatum]|uniref:FAD-dependent monooxygenase n=1 Tax=Rubellimicrobium aerolatum TaxID=490979 RepID=A0ABW0SB11_9RHOB|nr:FAD-dependent monooxygenase [Rubellimicrobium aerolatum]MBP1805422.1 2-octaprenyl-6-methoxyphenol hydroxylase [Rubellimicrobium aerolatum]
MDSTDILVAGGGTAGLAAAAAFGSLGLRVTCVDPAPAETPDGPDADLRTTAILTPGRALLEAAGLWDRLAPEATPLRVMRIVDARGTPVRRDFDAGDLGDQPFGWNVTNAVLKRAFAERLAGMPNVALRRGTGFAGRVAQVDEVTATLSDGSRVAARLLVGADGRDSAVRRACGIGVRTTRYGQKALVFAVTHDRPHGGVSTEVHASGGPFTLVPLPDHDGRPCSAVVWMTDGVEALRLKGLPDEEFARAVNARSAQVMGPLAPVGGRQLWPIVTQVADRVTARRTALMAEAAHVVPPIGAQGLNMSLGDLRTMIDLARARPDDIGEESWLAAYARAREPEIRLRAFGIDALNRASIGGLGPLRALGLRAMHGIGPVRRGLMQLGLGLR